MTEKYLAASRRLSGLNLNVENQNIKFDTYWCRVATSRADKWNYTEHSHSFFELQLCLEGECGFLVDGKTHILKKGTFLLLPPKRKHQILNATDDFSKFIWGVNIIDKDLSDLLSAAVSKTEKYSTDKSIFPAIDIVLENASCDEFGSYGIIKNQLDYILKMLIRQLTDIKETGEFAKKTSMQAQEIKKFIQDNISAKMRTTDIAAQFSLSERQLEGICKREYKMTVSCLKSEVRLEMIRKLLSETELSLGEIAQKCGFADEFVMGKFFKKHEEISPGRYRCASKE